jgi:hypothetical protein
MPRAQDYQNLYNAANRNKAGSCALPLSNDEFEYGKIATSEAL